MNRVRSKLSSGIGGRTGKNVLLNKKIRKLADGTDNFEDYFTDSSDGSTNTSASYSSVSKSPDVHKYPQAVDRESIQGVNCPSPIKVQSSRIVIGSRSKKNILPPQNIRKLSDGKDNYDDYFTDGGSYEDTFSCAISENPSPFLSPQVPSKSKNSSTIAPVVAHSSPITRLSSKVVCNDADDPSDSKAEDSGEEINPSVSEPLTNKIKNKGSSRKSMHLRHDSCDEKLLKLAEDNENIENFSDKGMQLHSTKKAKSNKSEVVKTSQRTASESFTKNNVLENPHLTRSRSHQGTPIKSRFQNTNNSLIKTAGKNISVKKHYLEQNIPKASQLNTFESKLRRCKSKQSHLDVNTAKNSDDVSSVSNQGSALFENENPSRELSDLNLTSNIVRKLSGKRNSSLTPNTARKLPVKRKSNLMRDVASKLPVKRKSNLTPNTASKKKSNSLVASSMHDKNAQISEDLPSDDLNVTFQVDNPQSLPLSNKKNSNNHGSEFYEKEKPDSNPSETLEISQKISSRSLKKTVSLVFPEKQHRLTSSLIESFIEIQSGNMEDMLGKTTAKNIPKQKKGSAPNSSDSNELRINISSHSHNDVNMAQDSEKSSEYNSVVEEERTLYGEKDVVRESNFISVDASKKITNSPVVSDENTTQDSEEEGVVEQERSRGRKDVAKKSNHIPVNTKKKKSSSSTAFDENTAQDSEEDSVLEQERSCRRKDVAKKSNHIPAKKNKLNSSVASDKKHMLANKHKEKMTSSLNLFDNSLNETDLNAQHIDGSPDNVLNVTFDVNNSELLSSDGETSIAANKNKDIFQVNAEAHDKENNEKNERTGQRKKKKKSHETTVTKIKNKGSFIAQENEAQDPCRRSKRNRFAPLEGWRNERAQYRFEKGSLHFIKVDPGTKLDDGSSKAVAARLLGQYNRKKELKKKLRGPSKIKFRDLILEKMVNLPLLKRFHLFPWEGQSDENGTFCLKRVIQTPNSTFGFIEIKAGKSKPLQYMPSEDIYLCLIRGKVTAIIAKNEMTLEEKDTLIVPRSVPYSIRNDGTKKALLVFSVGRYKYLENELFK